MRHFFSCWRSQSHFFLAALLLSFVFLIFSPESHAFSWKRHRKPPQKLPATIFETPEYRVVFHYDPALTREDLVGAEKKFWIEMNYKVVDLSEGSGALFSGGEGGKVRFLDKDGYILATDLFKLSDFKNADLYGWFWMEKDRVLEVIKADVISASSDEIRGLEERRKRNHELKDQEKKLLDREEDRPLGAPQESPSPLASPSVLPPAAADQGESATLSLPVETSQTAGSSPAPGSAANPDPEASMAPSPSPEPTGPVSADIGNVSPSPSPALSESSPSPSPDKFSGAVGVTNEEIEKELAEFNDRKPTALPPESPQTMISGQEKPIKEEAV